LGFCRTSCNDPKALHGRAVVTPRAAASDNMLVLREIVDVDLARRQRTGAKDQTPADGANVAVT